MILTMIEVLTKLNILKKAIGFFLAVIDLEVYAFLGAYYVKN